MDIKRSSGCIWIRNEAFRLEEQVVYKTNVSIQHHVDCAKAVQAHTHTRARACVTHRQTRCMHSIRRGEIISVNDNMYTNREEHRRVHIKGTEEDPVLPVRRKDNRRSGRKTPQYFQTGENAMPGQFPYLSPLRVGSWDGWSFSSVDWDRLVLTYSRHFERSCWTKRLPEARRFHRVLHTAVNWQAGGRGEVEPRPIAA